MQQRREERETQQDVGTKSAKVTRDDDPGADEDRMKQRREERETQQDVGTKSAKVTRDDEPGADEDRMKQRREERETQQDVGTREEEELRQDLMQEVNTSDSRDENKNNSKRYQTKEEIAEAERVEREF